MKQRMRKFIKVFLITFTALAALCAVGALAACSSSGPVSDAKWNRSDNLALSFVRESDCPDGNVNEEKISSEMNCKLNETYLMVVDFTIQAASDNDGRSTVDLVVNVSPSEVLYAKVKDAASSKVTENTTQSSTDKNGNETVGRTNIKANFSIPDKKSNVKNVRIVVELRATMEGQAQIDISLKDGTSSDVQLAKTGELNKKVTVGYTEELTYRVSDDKYIVTGVSSKTLTKIIIPSEIAGYNVVGIDENAFNGCNYLKEILITNGIKTIGNSAFYGCKALTNIDIPESVTEIADSAFYNCTALADVALSEGVKTIGDNAFSGCTGLTRITMSENLKTIGQNAFSGCKKLASVSIAETVNTIGESAFYNCSALKTVNITDLAAWCKISFGSSTANPLYYAGNLKLNGKTVTTLVIPSSIKSVGDYAFYNCSGLTCIVVSDNVTKIGKSAFRGCESANTVVLGSKVKTVGEEAFYGCKGLELVVMESSVTTIGDRAFSSCSDLKSVVLSRSLTQIGINAFSGCTALSELTFRGSAARWEKVTKGSGWCDSALKTVRCSDEDVTLTK